MDLDLLKFIIWETRVILDNILNRIAELNIYNVQLNFDLKMVNVDRNVNFITI